MRKLLSVLTFAMMLAGTAPDAFAQGAQRKGQGVARPVVSSAAAPIRGVRRPVTTPGIGGPATGARIATPGGRAVGVARAASTPGAMRRPGAAGAQSEVNVARPGGLKK